MRASQLSILTLFMATIAAESKAAEPAPTCLPAPAPGWTIELVARSPQIRKPTSIAVAADGTVWVGQAAPEKTNAASPHGGSVRVVKDGTNQLFMDGLNAVSGLEWIDGTLYVLHPPRLSAFRVTQKDRQVQEGIDLVSGLGQPNVTAQGIQDPIAAGLRAGMDGFLYMAVGDEGIPRAAGRDGQSITLAGGGVVRVRPDGSHLEVVSTGERKPRSIMLTSSGEIFTVGGSDPGHRWAGGLTHHVRDGHYGYPYQFLTAPFRALPLMGGQADEPGTQGVWYDEAGLPTRQQGKLFVCDWSRQSVVCFEVRKAGGSFAIAHQTSIVTRGSAADFHPLALAATADGAGFWLADWASEKWSSTDPLAGRLYRLTYSGADRISPSPRPDCRTRQDWIAALDHPAFSVRLEAQRKLAGQGADAVQPLIERAHGGQPEAGLLHTLWALDAIGTAEARRTIREALSNPSASVRIQAVRMAGIRADRDAGTALVDLLGDREPAVRREAAIALGSIGDRSAIAPLLAHLGDADRFAAWSVRTAIHRLGDPDEAAMQAALLDLRRRENTLKLADESWSRPIIQSLVASLSQTPEPAIRGRIVANLAGQYRKYPAWSGTWWGPDPLAAGLPRKTEDWDARAMSMVLQGLKLGLGDQDSAVRFQSIIGLGEVGPAAAPVLCEGMTREPDVRNQALLAEALSVMNDAGSVRLLTTLAVDSRRSEPVRAAALDGLARFRGRSIVRARLAVLYDPTAPESLIARALPPLARDGVLPPNDLAAFFDSPRPLVRAAALMSLNVNKPLPLEIRQAVLARLDDPSTEVRQAAVMASGVLKLREAIPRLVQTAQADQADAALRAHAISALCLMPDLRARSVYHRAATDPDPSLRRAAGKALLALGSPADPQLSRAGGSSAPPPAIAALRQFALSHLADSRQGEELFFENQELACGRCHAAAGRGAGTPGPDLSNLSSRRDKADIIRLLLEPPASVATAHSPVKNLARTLSPLQFTDLVGFLEKLKQPSSRLPTTATP